MIDFNRYISLRGLTNFSEVSKETQKQLERLTTWPIPMTPEELHEIATVEYAIYLAFIEAVNSMKYQPIDSVTSSKISYDLYRKVNYWSQVRMESCTTNAELSMNGEPGLVTTIGWTSRLIKEVRSVTFRSAELRYRPDPNIGKAENLFC